MLTEVCNSATKIVQEEANKRNINERCHITKFSAENGYLLRYIKYKDNIDALSDKNIAKLATLIVGSKWRKDILGQKRKTESQLSTEQKEKIADYIKDIISDEEEMEEYYEMCNYQQFIIAFNAMITDNSQEIYEGKISLILQESSNPNWDDIDRINKFYKNIKKKFGKINKTLLDKMREIIENILNKPNGKTIKEMTCYNLYSHLYKLRHIEICIIMDDEVIDETLSNIKNRFIEISKYHNDLIELSDGSKISIIDILLKKWTKLFKIEEDRVDTLYNIFNYRINYIEDYSNVMKYLNKESVDISISKKLTDLMICKWFEYQSTDIDFVYNIRCMYDECRDMIGKYPLLKKLIVLHNPMRSYVVSDIQKYDNNELKNEIDNEAICEELKVLCCRITE